jgi:hypothetical protein
LTVLFIIVDETAEMGTDAREGDQPLPGTVYDDRGDIVEHDLLRVSQGDVAFRNDECPGLFSRSGRDEIADERVEQGGQRGDAKGRQ